jgi:hypothetical protein
MVMEGCFYFMIFIIGKKQVISVTLFYLSMACENNTGEKGI